MKIMKNDSIYAKEKIYAIEFMEYTNWERICVYNEKTDSYIYLSNKGPLLVRESDLPKYQDYGNGIKSIDYVGVMIADKLDK